MEGSYARMSPEFALVQALEHVPVLTGNISSMQPPKTARPPFAFYIPTADSESQDLDGPSGLQKFSAALHIVAATHRHLMSLCPLVKAAVQGMRGEVFSTPVIDSCDDLKGRVLIEDCEISQSSPDLYETEVGYYRRVYTVDLDYQTEEVYEEVISG